MRRSLGAGAWARLVSASLLCFAPPVVAYFAFNADGDLFFPLGYCAIVEGLFVYRYLAARFRPEGLRPFDRAAGAVLAGIVALGAALILVGLNITPVSAYLAWFALVRQGQSTGTLAYMFTIKFAFFSSAFAGLFLVGDPVFALLCYVFINAVVLAVILASAPLAALAIAVLFGALLYRSLSGRRSPVRGSLAPGLAVIGLAVLFAIPLTRYTARNPAVDAFFAHPLNGLVESVVPNFPFLYNVPGYGYSFGNTELGGPASLTPAPVFELEARAGETVYLRTASYDDYTGTAWQLSGALERMGEWNASKITATTAGILPVSIPVQLRSSFPSRRVSGESYPHAAIPAAAKRAATVRATSTSASTSPFFRSFGRYGRFGLGAPYGFGYPSEQPVRVIPSRTEPSITVRLVVDFFSAIPHTVDTSGFQFPSERRPRISYGSLETGFLLSVPVTRGYVVTLERKTPSYDVDRNGDLTVDASSRINPFERLFDLQVGKVPEEVRRLAATLARPTEQETLAAIRAFLTENYTYSLNTRAPGPKKDLVDDFLFHTKKGYCVHFATAFVILARLNYIPARYVTGFLAYFPPDSDSVVVTGLQAHAWAETWDDSLGWVTQEATPPMEQSALSDPSYYQDFNPTDSPETLRELRAIMGNRVPLEGQSKSDASAKAPSRASRLIPDAPIAAAALVLLALAASAAVLVSRRLAPPEARARRIARAMARRAGRNRLPDPRSRGWKAWAEEAAGRDPERPSLTRRAAELILRLSFSGRELAARDIAFLVAYYRRVFRRRIARKPPSAARKG